MAQQPISSYDFLYDDYKQTFNFNNPGQIDLSQANPALWAQINGLQSLQNQFRPTLQSVMNPGYYNDLRDEYGQRAETAAMNRYAKMGLAGSSVATGGMMEASRQNDLAFRDRQVNEQLRAMQTDAMLNSAITKDILAGQSMYGAFQEQAMNMTLGLQQQKNNAEAANAQIWGSIAQGALTGAGFALAGPAGGMAGASVGGTLKSAAPQPSMYNYYEPNSWSPSSYNSQYFGEIG